MGSLSSILTNISAAIPELFNSSATAIYKKIAEALSITIDATTDEFINTESIIDANIAKNNYGKAGYYIAAALYYEDGENMIIDPITLNWIYNPVDVSKQTISQAAFDETSMILKVAYLDPNTNLLAKLPNDVLIRFINYFNTASDGGFAIPGIPISIVSLDANVFNASSFIIHYLGSYSLVTLQTAVQNALNTFRDTFEYNGVLYINDLIEYIKANVEGVRDVTILLPEIDGTVFSGSNILSAGYFNYSESLSLTYVAV